MFEKTATKTKPKNATGPLTSREVEILVKTLARIDAAFVPVREFSSPLSQNAYRVRTTHKSAGVEWIGSSDEAERKANERARDALTAGRYLRTMRRRSIRTTGIVLTDKGEAIARAAAGLPSLSDSRRILERIVKLAAEEHTAECGISRKWVQETRLAEFEYPPDTAAREKMVALEEAILPALVRGWAESTSDIHGRVWYAIARPVPDADAAKVATLPTQDEEIRGIYYDAVRAALASLQSATPDARELGLVPISASPILIRPSK